MGSTSSCTANEVLPAALLAVMVYVEFAAVFVGVPDMTPLDALRVSPGGSVGLTT
jgi:hypothetical protein